jgi:hypothetical protein
MIVVFSMLRRLALRTLVLLGAIALVIAIVYVPSRWTGAIANAARREELRRPPPDFVRVNRERVPPPLVRFRMVATNFAVITSIGWIGRYVLRLRLKRL